MKKQELKNAGLKITVPRIKILEILSTSNERHMRAEDVYRQLSASGEDVGLATVYRVLTQFETAGLVVRHHFEENHSVFELNQGEHHDHLVCTHCGHVEEFMDAIIEEQQAKVAQDAGYIMTDHSLNIYGVCPACQTSKSQSNSPFQSSTTSSPRDRIEPERGH